MTHILDVRRTPEGMRYRVWTTVSDCYYSEPLTKEQFHALYPHFAPSRVALAETHGTDSWREGDEDILDEPWTTELDEYGNPRGSEEESSDG